MHQSHFLQDKQIIFIVRWAFLLTYIPSVRSFSATERQPWWLSLKVDWHDFQSRSLRTGEGQLCCYHLFKEWMNNECKQKNSAVISHTDIFSYMPWRLLLQITLNSRRKRNKTISAMWCDDFWALTVKVVYLHFSLWVLQLAYSLLKATKNKWIDIKLCLTEKQIIPAASPRSLKGN